jgi:hypothetical protein
VANAHPRVLIAIAIFLCACSGGGPSAPGGPQCRPFATSCTTGPECCSGACSSGLCDCSATSGAACAGDGECCPGLRCAGGSCAIGCRAQGAPCSYGGDCCTMRCLPGHVCGPPCTGPGGACTASDQCCTYLGCPGGSVGSPATCSFACKDSSAFLEACAGDGECCSGYHCRAGYCQAGTCGAESDYCLSDADCCTSATPRLHCEGSTNRCACGALAASCVDGADCCGGLECRSGQCHPPAGSVDDDLACVDASDCVHGTCRPTALPTGLCCTGQGVACGTSSRCCPSVSGPSLTCLAVTGTCDLPRDVGGACASAYDCTTGHCQGDVCCTTQSVSCASDLECCSTHCGIAEDGSGPRCCQGLDSPCSGPSQACCLGYTCDLFGTSVCKALPGTSCAIDADCYMGQCVSGSCRGGLRAPCGPQWPCLSSLVCSANGLCLEPPGGPCASSFDCDGSDYYDTAVACLEGACCLQPGVSSATCGASGGADGSQCCSTACAGSSCACSGALAPCSDSSRCCVGASSCIVPDPSGVGDVCCSGVGQTCRTRSDCCDVAQPSWRAAAIDCPAAGPAALRCCVGTGQACSAGEPCCSGAACPSTGKSPTCP